MNYVDESEIDDLNEFFGYVEKTLELNDFDTIDEYGVECHFNPTMSMVWNVISIRLMSIPNWRFMIMMTRLAFAVDYDLTSNSELVDMVLQVEFLYTDNGYTVRFLNVDPG